jgi:hypothetical protein
LSEEQATYTARPPAPQEMRDAESAEKYARAREEDRRTAWASYHRNLSDLHAARADEHAQQAAKLAGTEKTDLA